MVLPTSPTPATRGSVSPCLGEQWKWLFSRNKKGEKKNNTNNKEALVFPDPEKRNRVSGAHVYSLNISHGGEGTAPGSLAGGQRSTQLSAPGSPRLEDRARNTPPRGAGAGGVIHEYCLALGINDRHSPPLTTEHTRCNPMPRSQLREG